MLKKPSRGSIREKSEEIIVGIQFRERERFWRETWRWVLLKRWVWTYVDVRILISRAAGNRGITF